MFIIKIIIAIICVESITEIIVKSNIFAPIREFIGNRIEKSLFFLWLDMLINCGHCMSVWVSWFIYFILLFDSVVIVNVYIDWFLIGLVIQRLSNYLHFIVDRIDPNHN